MSEPHIYTYNLFRACAALGVLAYHLNGNEGWEFGFFDPLIHYATLYMTFFFILSGFILTYNYNNVNFFDNNSIFNFYKKRFISIFPIYYFVYFFFLILSNDSIKDIVITFPIQITLLQEFQHYSFLQNDGMWFLSVIMVCYFLFPLLSYIFKMKNNAIILLILLIITAFLPLIAIKYSLNLYTNIISRVIEFSIGIILYYNYKKNENMCFKHIYIC